VDLQLLLQGHVETIFIEHVQLCLDLLQILLLLLELQLVNARLFLVRLLLLADHSIWLNV